MARIVVIDTPRPGFERSFRLTLLFLAVAFVAFLPIVFVTVPHPDIAYWLVAAYIFFATLAVYPSLAIYLRARSVRRLASSISFSGGYFYAPSSIPAEYGFLTVVRRAEGLHRSFTVQSPQDFSSHPLLPEAHLIVADIHGNGKIVLPGYRLSGKYSRVLVLFFVPYYSVYFEKDRLSIQSINDVADVFLQVTDTGFSGYLRHNLSRGIGADVFLSWIGSDVVLPLAASNSSESFYFPSISEPTVIVAVEDYISPETLARALGFETIVQGTGSFRITLGISFPMEPDAYDSTDVNIAPRSMRLS